MEKYIWIGLGITAGLAVALALIVLVAACLYILSTRCRKGHPGVRKFRPWLYTHRGLYNENRPENSLAAFRAAVNNGFGIELDVHLLKDGQLAVIHDHDLLRITGIEGKIEDLSADDLWDYRLQGTEETIPTFREVLDTVAGKVPLIVELKSNGKNYNQLTQAACELLDHYDGLYCLESFDPRCVLWLKKNRPDLIRGQLSENYLKRNQKVPYIVRFLLTRQMLNFLTLPDFVAYRYEDRQRLGNKVIKKFWGATRVTWTVQTKEDLIKAKKEGWIPIFEGFIP